MKIIGKLFSFEQEILTMSKSKCLKHDHNSYERKVEPKKYQ